MSITDELRKWAARELASWKMARERYDALLDIADRIDAEHERQMADAFETRNSDENLESDGWARLPVDADGEPIRFGDEVEWRRTCSEDYSVTEHGTVDGLEIYEVNGEIFAHITINRNGYNVRMPSSALRHHHVTTVEDVLREFAAEFVGMANHVDDHEVTDAIEMYASKLRLAGDE